MDTPERGNPGEKTTNWGGYDVQKEFATLCKKTAKETRVKRVSIFTSLMTSQRRRGFFTSPLGLPQETWINHISESFRPSSPLRDKGDAGFLCSTQGRCILPTHVSFVRMKGDASYQPASPFSVQGRLVLETRFSFVRMKGDAHLEPASPFCTTKETLLKSRISLILIRGDAPYDTRVSYDTVGSWHAPMQHNSKFSTKCTKFAGIYVS